MLHQKPEIRFRLVVHGDTFSVFCNKYFGQKFTVVGFVYIHSREGPSWPLWVEFLEVKAVEGVSEVGLVWFCQYVCPLTEAIFNDIGPFPQGFELSWH